LTAGHVCYGCFFTYLQEWVWATFGDWKNHRPHPMGSGAPEILLYHISVNLSRGKIEKSIQKKDPEFVQNYLLTFG
jgi:hypothetical protein